MTPQKQEYKGETINLQKPALNEFKASIKNMGSDMQQNLVENTEMLEEMYMSESDVQPIKDTVQKHLEEVMKLSCKSYLIY